MAYIRFQSVRFGLDVLAPAQSADDLAWREGADELLGAALVHYNRALTAASDNRIPEALEQIDMAVRTFPYAPVIEELATVLHLQHGHLPWVYQLIQHLIEQGEEELGATYLQETQQQVRQWNVFLTDTEALKQKYQDDKAQISYRELLLLAERSINGVPPSVRAHADDWGISLSAPFPPSSGALDSTAASATPWRWATAILAALVVTLGAMTVIRSGKVDTVTDGTDTATESPRPDAPPSGVAALQQAGRRFLAADTSAEEALDALNLIPADADVPEADVERLQRLIVNELYAEAETVWRARDYHQVRHLLQIVQGAGGLNDLEGYYRLGLAAAELADTSTAVTALERSIAFPETETSYYTAEALYRLALLTDGEEGTAYAQALVRRYPNSIYNNSRIKNLLP